MSRLMTVFLRVVAPTLALILAWLGFATAQTNRLGWFLFLVGAAYLLGIIFYYRKQSRELRARREETGDRSFWLILPGFILVFFGAPLEYLYLPETWTRDLWMQTVGVVFLGVSIALLIWARLAIGGLYSGHVQIQSEHQLVQTGPYRYIRHPGYMSYLLMALGLSTGYSSIIALGATLALLLPGLIYRIAVEEKLLAHEYGDEYQTYIARTWRLFPKVW